MHILMVCECPVRRQNSNKDGRLCERCPDCKDNHLLMQKVGADRAHLCGELGCPFCKCDCTSQVFSKHDMHAWCWLAFPG